MSVVASFNFDTIQLLYCAPLEVWISSDQFHLNKTQLASRKAGMSTLSLQVPDDAGIAPPSLVLVDATHGSDGTTAIDGVVLFLEGDQIVDDAAREDIGEPLVSPLGHLKMLQGKCPPGWIPCV